MLIIEDMYLSDGWYSDGKTNQMDYYISFSIHFYLLIYHYYSHDEENTEKYLNRAILFSKTFVYWFADNGAGIPFGRSLTYKFAQAAFWAALSMHDIPPDVKALAKGIIYRNIQWWFEKNIFDKNGLLVLGYAYPNQQMVEIYNASGSSYWAFKTFIFLLIPPEDGFWKSSIRRINDIDPRKLIKPARMVICRYNGNPYAFINGQRSASYFCHTECKYEKFVYSIESGFCISRSCKSLALSAPDSTIAISFNDVDFISRSNYEAIKTEENCLTSVWEPTYRIKITTLVIPNAPAHIRIHYVETCDHITLVDGGFALRDQNNKVSYADGFAYVNENGTLSAAGSLLGTGEPICIHAAPNANILYEHSIIPLVRYSLKPGNYKIIDWFYLGQDDRISAKQTQEFKTDNDMVQYCNDFVNTNINSSAAYDIPNNLLTKIKKIKKSLIRIIRSI